MLGKEPFRTVFASGVVRFDAHGNLFVNLPHSDENPQKVFIGAPDSGGTAPPERRARVHGAHASPNASGAFPGCADLPRGLTVEFKGYTSAVFEDGTLIVSMDAGASLPDWWESGQDHFFAAAAEPLRLWVKSSLPDGVTLADKDAETGHSAQAKPVARGQFQPVSEKAAPAPKPAQSSASNAPPPASKAAPKEAYRPPKLPAGHLNPAGAKKSGLGCSTLLLLMALASGAATVLL